MTEDDKLNISKEEIFAGKIKDETVSYMAKMTAKQIYWQGFNMGVEMAANHCDGMGEEARISENIRSLKK